MQITYISNFFQIMEGRIFIRLTSDVYLMSQESINDNLWHDVKVTTDEQELSIFIDSNINATTLTLNNSISVATDYVFIGGLPDIVNQVLRSDDGLNGRDSGGQDQTRKSIFDNPFHGYLQDLRLNEIFLFMDPNDKENFQIELRNAYYVTLIGLFSKAANNPT